MPKKVLLIILDGYGKAKNSKGNAIELAKKPFIDSLRETYPTTLLKAAGNAVGLPKGYMGNSEVGHFTIGAGRIVYQSLEMINREIKSGLFFKNKELRAAMDHVIHYKSKLHLLGMTSDEGVHAHTNHLFALLEMAAQKKIPSIYIHAITDGRDVPEKSAKKYLKQILHKIDKFKVAKIATICGRYYAMDRDKNWNRTSKSYQLLTLGKGFKEKDPLKAIDHAYQRGDHTDYYIQPIILDNHGLIEQNDAVIFFNFRTDRAAQLTKAFTEKNFSEFPIQKLKLHFTCMGPYSKVAKIAFHAPKIKNNLGQILSKHHLSQLRIAETEKYAHITFFFNSQIKTPYKGESRVLIHSPKVPSYAQKPEMSAKALTNALLRELKRKKTYNLIVLNYANGDLVGHSGELKPTIQCIQVLNECLQKLIPFVLKEGYHILLTADHGNAEQMFYPNGQKCPSHTTNPVECTLISEQFGSTRLKSAKGLQDFAPTILDILGIKKPKEMSGESLIIQ